MPFYQMCGLVMGWLRELRFMPMLPTGSIWHDRKPEGRFAHLSWLRLAKPGQGLPAHADSLGADNPLAQTYE